MRIAYFLDSTGVLGGAGNLLIQQANLMSEMHDVFVIIPCDARGRYNLEYENRCRKLNLKTEILEYTTSYNFYDVDLLRSLECIKKIREMSIYHKIDFFHSVQLNVAAELVSRELGIPHLMSIYQLKEDEFKLYAGDIFAHYHLCDSELYSRRWRKCLNVESRCIRPIAPADRIVRKADYEGSELRVLMLGTVCERKNQLCAIRAVENCMKNYDIELIIAGDYESPYGEQCRKYIKEKKLEQAIQMVGFVSDIRKLLVECDCLLCASRDESFPSSIVEALTYDLVIISTPVAGVPELFHDGVNSMLSGGYEADDIEEVLSRTFQAYQCEQIIHMQEKARELWKQNFSPNLIRKQMESYYQYIADKEANLERYTDITDIVIKTQRVDQLIEEMPEKEVYKRRALYYSFLMPQIQGKRICIWGAGNLGKQAYHLIDGLNIGAIVEAFIDKRKEGKYLGIPIMKPEDIDHMDIEVVIIGFWSDTDEAVSFLEERGWKYNENVWKLP